MHPFVALSLARFCRGDSSVALRAPAPSVAAAVLPGLLFARVWLVRALREALHLHPIHPFSLQTIAGTTGSAPVIYTGFGHQDGSGSRGRFTPLGRSTR